MFDNVDFQNLRGVYSRVLVALKPNAEIKKYIDKLDAAVKPMVDNYDEVDVLVKLTYKTLRGELKSTQFRTVHKPIIIPDDTVCYYAKIKLVAKQKELILETKEDSPFLKTQSVYVEENLTARQQDALLDKMRRKATFSTMASMEQIEETSRRYISFKQPKTLSV